MIGISLVGCRHTPPRPVELDQARMTYAEAHDNPQVASRAPVALREAEEALLYAEQTWDKEKDVREVQNLTAIYPGAGCTRIHGRWYERTCG